MLYCPKCQAMYEDGTQRFCTNEGARLLPTASSENSGQPAKGVFTSILNKSSVKKEDSTESRKERSESKNLFSAFQPPNRSKFFKEDEEEEIEEKTEPIVQAKPEKAETEKLKPFEHLPLAGIINPSALPEKQTKTDQIFSKENLFRREKIDAPKQEEPETESVLEKSESSEEAIPEQISTKKLNADDIFRAFQENDDANSEDSPEREELETSNQEELEVSEQEEPETLQQEELEISDQIEEETAFVKENDENLLDAEIEYSDSNEEFIETNDEEDSLSIVENDKDKDLDLSVEVEEKEDLDLSVEVEEDEDLVSNVEDEELVSNVEDDEPEALFEDEDENLLETPQTEDLDDDEDLSEGLSIPDDFDQFELLEEETQSVEKSDSDEDFELNLDRNGNVEDNRKIGLDAGFDDVSPNQENELELEPIELFQKTELSESNGDIELDLDDEEISPLTESAQKFELELDDLEDVAVSAEEPANIELDLESKKEVNLYDSIPRIELDLADLEDVSVTENAEEFEPEKEEIKFEKETSEEISEEIPEETPEETEVFEEEEFQEPELEIQTEPEKEEEMPVIPVVFDDNPIRKPLDLSEKGELEKKEETSPEISEEKVPEKTPTKKPDEDESRWLLYALIGIVVLGLALLGFFYLTNDSSNGRQSSMPAANQNQTRSNNVNANLNAVTNVNTNLNSNVNSAVTNNANQMSEPKPTLTDGPPPPREIIPPPDTVLFKNEKRRRRGKLADSFLGFSLYYPKDWKENRTGNNFLDVAKKTPQGLPIKQLLVAPYDSKGTFELDKELFNDLAEKSNNDLKRILSNYQVLSQNETTFQDGRWKAYEVKFQGVSGNQKVVIWGKRLWIPVQRPGMKSGFVITLIGSSLSDDVKSVADLGANDDLAQILKTFEPEIF